LDYNKIKKEITSRNFSIKKFIEGKIGLTENGFYMAVKNDTLKVRDLEKISRALELPMTHWFEDDTSDLTAREERIWNEFSKSHEKQLLKEQLQQIMRSEIIIENQEKKLKEFEDELKKCREELKNERKRTG
jgi:hypothetical protein